MATPTGDGAEVPEIQDAYKPPEKKTIDEIVKLDAEDESLQRYKQSLLGGASAGAAVPFPNDRRNVIVKSLDVVVKNGPTVTLDLSGDLSHLKDKPIEIPEGSTYHVNLTFYVQREIISGLRYVQEAKRLHFKVEKDKVMLGSYPPQMKPIEWRSSDEEAPSGMAARGVYTMESIFSDDDGNEHVSFKWAIKIVKAPSA